MTKPGPRAEPAHPTTARAVTTSTKNGFTRLSIPGFSYADWGEFERPPASAGIWGAEGKQGAYARAAGSDTIGRNSTLAQINILPNVNAKPAEGH